VLMVVYLTLKFFRDGSIFPPHPASINETLGFPLGTVTQFRTCVPKLYPPT
jgi:hypothetical protein